MLYRKVTDVHCEDHTTRIRCAPSSFQCGVGADPEPIYNLKKNKATL